jgi:hypothetical protein
MWNTRFSGTLAGAIETKGGYRDVRLNGRRFRGHWIIWALMTGEWPTHEIDHIDGDGSNNRWANLRLATHAENAQNLPPAAGCTWDKKRRKWAALIKVDCRTINLGRFDTEAEAHAAYLAAKRIYHPFQPEPRI